LKKGGEFKTFYTGVLIVAPDKMGYLPFIAPLWAGQKRGGKRYKTGNSFGTRTTWLIPKTSCFMTVRNYEGDTTEKGLRDAKKILM